MKFNFSIEKFAKPWVKEVSSSIILVFFLGPFDRDIFAKNLDSLFKMFVRERCNLLNSDNSNILGLKLNLLIY